MTGERWHLALADTETGLVWLLQTEAANATRHPPDGPGHVLVDAES